jgi:hypothetical protein
VTGRKHTTITAGGKTYNLRASFNALATFEENIGSITILEGQNPKILTGARGLIWAANNACGGAKITIDQAGDICEDYISEHGMAEFVRKVQNILESGGWLGSGDADPNAQQIEKTSEK